MISTPDVDLYNIPGERDLYVDAVLGEEALFLGDEDSKTAGVTGSGHNEILCARGVSECYKRQCSRCNSKIF